jgi:cellulose synthase/poly-beta-1,6-N-acetylglucosamine synthase-like glycosyltransferase
MSRISNISSNNMKENMELSSISILIPTHNEEKVINYKLDNISNIIYPKEKMEILVVDSASTDNTINMVNDFIKNKNSSIRVYQEKLREGKSKALNKALDQVNNEIIIVSDADCFWDKRILINSLHHFDDPSIGAITGIEKILNESDSWIIRNEKKYKNNMINIRLGESKIHSSIIFEGGFGAYRRKDFPGFDEITGADDTGTALNIVQSGKRTINVKNSVFYTSFPTSFKDKILIKKRRANHLIKIWGKCLGLLIKGKLKLPKIIAIPNIFLHLVNPLIFIFTSIISLLIILDYNIIVLPFILMLLIPLSRDYFIEFSLNNLVLFSAVLNVISGKQFIMWEISENARELDYEKYLTENKLI